MTNKDLQKLIEENIFEIYEYYQTRKNSSFRHFPLREKILSEYDYIDKIIKTSLFTIEFGDARAKYEHDEDDMGWWTDVIITLNK